MRNPVRWFEIYVEDMNRAKAFYEKVFQLKLSQMHVGDELEMWGFPFDRERPGCTGTLVKMPGLKPSGISTVIYFGSEDCKVEERRILDCGGKVHKAKFSIGEYGFITLGFDTEGNMFGIHSQG